MTASEFISQQLVNIRDTVGNNNVICALSGGVDSTVVACLLKALGQKVTCVFVDHGLLQEKMKQKKLWICTINI